MSQNEAMTAAEFRSAEIRALQNVILVQTQAGYFESEMVRKAKALLAKMQPEVYVVPSEDRAWLLLQIESAAKAVVDCDPLNYPQTYQRALDTLAYWEKKFKELK